MTNPSNSSKKLGGWTAVAAGLIGLCLLAYLAWEYYQLKLGLASSKSACNISATFNCDVVALSPYAQLFSVPMAIWGLWTHAMFVVLMLAAIFGVGQNPGRLGRLAQFFSWILLLASAVMGFISTAKLGTYCLFCMGTYATSILAFVGAMLWNRGNETSMAESLASTLTEARALLLFFAAIPAFGFLSHSMMMDSYGGKQLAPAIREYVGNWRANPPQNFDPQKGLIYQNGSQEPKVTIVEFIDLLCPHCKVATPGIHSFAEGRSDVRLIVKLFPLDGNCSSDPQMPKRDGLRCQWSHALFCFEQVAQKGWPALDWIFAHQAELSLASFDNQIKTLSDELQVSAEEVKKCSDQSAVADLVIAMSAEGSKASIQGTPSVFVNGKSLDGGQFLPVLDEAYKAAKE